MPITTGGRHRISQTPRVGAAPSSRACVSDHPNSPFRKRGRRRPGHGVLVRALPQAVHRTRPLDHAALSEVRLQEQRLSGATAPSTAIAAAGRGRSREPRATAGSRTGGEPSWRAYEDRDGTAELINVGGGGRSESGAEDDSRDPQAAAPGESQIGLRVIYNGGRGPEDLPRTSDFSARALSAALETAPSEPGSSTEFER